MTHRTARIIAACVALSALLLIAGCPTNATEGANDTLDGTTDNGGDATGTGTDGDGTDNSGTIGDGTDGGDDGQGTGDDQGDDAVSQTYDPTTSMALQTDTLQLGVPAAATTETVTITMRPATAADLPSALPDNADLAGGVFGPSGQTFDESVEVSLQLSAATILPVLPVVTYDEAAGKWVGTGSNATVAPNGIDVTFTLDHFSIAGVPTPVPLPEAGGAVGSFIVISNNGSFTSDEISSDNAALTYSEFGDTFSISMTSQSIGDDLSIDTASLGLTAVSVYQLGNYVVGVCSGGRSLFNGGDFNEPAFGVMIMAVSGKSVSVSVFATTLERVIAGTLTGQTL
ncbi:MAG: hypothetical protein KKB50_12185 [Planctomycetes bacterium]|nr:hypothetical protein [Planctomycetota bacterium]